MACKNGDLPVFELPGLVRDRSSFVIVDQLSTCSHIVLQDPPASFVGDTSSQSHVLDRPPWIPVNSYSAKSQLDDLYLDAIGCLLLGDVPLFHFPVLLDPWLDDLREPLPRFVVQLLHELRALSVDLEADAGHGLCLPDY